MQTVVRSRGGGKKEGTLVSSPRGLLRYGTLRQQVAAA